ncbi:MAG: hypothetical protein M0011_00860 [Elusimicrobia bacterium]|nr:hypothetical protein [Elusimicrobiota bacterium]
MDKERIKSVYLPAAAAAGGMTLSVLAYGAAAFFLARSGYRPALAGQAAATVCYVLYALAAGPLLLIKPLAARLEAARETPEGTAKGLAAAAIVKAALCEVPAVSGLLLFLLAGKYGEAFFFMAFSLALGAFNFPKLPEWEEKLGTAAGRVG